MEFQAGLGNEHFLLRELVKRILVNAHAFEWTIQGFGMLRLYMENGLRMALWSNKHRIKHVSLMHTHPWQFRSLVMAGAILNRTYSESIYPDQSFPYMKQVIHAGEGGGLEDEPVSVLLRAQSVDEIMPGEYYSQQPDDIHVTDFKDGTITLCTRHVPEGRSPNHAMVYWPSGYDWVSAEPRPATKEEVSSFVQDALLQLTAAEHPLVAGE